MKHRGPLLVVAMLAVAACDTGDGKTLTDPTGTLAPTTTVITSADAASDPLDQLGTLASLPLAADIDDVESAEQLPDDFDGDDFQLETPWVDGAPMDARYTCDGADVPPALSWLDTPTDAVELAVVVIDELSPDNFNGVHWVLAGLEPTTSRLVESEVPLGAVQGLNSFGELGWTGPCPSPGSGQQTYRFTVFALGQQIEIPDGGNASEMITFIESVAFASTDVLATYER